MMKCRPTKDTRRASTTTQKANKGWSFDRYGKCVVRLQWMGSKVYLGIYNTPAEAEAAIAERKMFLPKNVWELWTPPGGMKEWRMTREQVVSTTGKFSVGDREKEIAPFLEVKKTSLPLGTNQRGVFVTKGHTLKEGYPFCFLQGEVLTDANAVDKLSMEDERMGKTMLVKHAGNAYMKDHWINGRVGGNMGWLVNEAGGEAKIPQSKANSALWLEGGTSFIYANRDICGAEEIVVESYYSGGSGEVKEEAVTRHSFTKRSMKREV